MTRSAKRRWSTDPECEIDGLVLGPEGPIVLHGYDPPAGGKWVDDVIPGKLMAYDRSSGERLWSSPCEVGYGRGFGAGFDEDGALVILGPSQSGHRITCMSPTDGVLLGVEAVPEFDEAHVATDMCLCIGPTSISGIVTSAMLEAWRFRKEGYRFHRAARSGEKLFVTFSRKSSKTLGIMILNVADGGLVGEFLPPEQKGILGMSASDEVVAVLVDDLEAALPPDQARDFMLRRLASDDDFSGEGASPGIVVYDANGGTTPLWFEDLGAGGGDDPGEPSMAIDSGKLYLARGASLEVRDQLTGRALGELVVPGLDEYVDWTIATGAFLLAEETRATVFEVPD
ncbi:MAG: hypothetical protein ACYSWX_02195 [Planctomycetota bacterium]|jgi:hypothetical protein